MRKNSNRRHNLIRPKLQKTDTETQPTPGSKLKLRLNKTGTIKNKAVSKDTSRSSSTSVRAKCTKRKKPRAKPGKSKTPFVGNTSIVKKVNARAQSTQHSSYSKKHPCNIRLFHKLTRENIDQL